VTIYHHDVTGQANPDFSHRDDWEFCTICIEERAEAEQRSYDSAVIADAQRYGLKFCGDSIRLHKKLGITEPWNEWEWPRRLAAIRIAKGGEAARASA